MPQNIPQCNQIKRANSLTPQSYQPGLVISKQMPTMIPHPSSYSGLGCYREINSMSHRASKPDMDDQKLPEMEDERLFGMNTEVKLIKADQDHPLAEPIQCMWTYPTGSSACRDKFNTIQKIVDHLETVHTATKKRERGSSEKLMHVCYWNLCDRLNEPFASKQNLLVHLRLHTGHKPYQCSLWSCNKQFTHYREAKAHLRTHTKEQPYSCGVCNVKYSHKGNYNYHMDTKHPAKITSISPLPATSYVSLNIGIEDQELPGFEEERLSRLNTKPIGADQDLPLPEPIQCMWTYPAGSKPCRETFKTMQDIADHLQTAHIVLQKHKSSQINMHVCNWLGCDRHNKSFPRRENLISHLSVHTGQRPYRCPWSGCNKLFYYYKEAKIHIRTHTT